MKTKTSDTDMVALPESSNRTSEPDTSPSAESKFSWGNGIHQGTARLCELRMPLLLQKLAFSVFLTSWAWFKKQKNTLKKPISPNVGIEPTTTRLRVVRSTDWANSACSCCVECHRGLCMFQVLLRFAAMFAFGVTVSVFPLSHQQFFSCPPSHLPLLEVVSF